jgi:hypothetical protein
MWIVSFMLNILEEFITFIDLQDYMASKPYHIPNLQSCENLKSHKFIFV